MCLDKIHSQPQPVSTIESGWKYFDGFSGKPLQFPHFPNGANGTTVAYDKWIEAANKDKDIGGYKAGFHIFTDEAVAKKTNSTVRRVYYRNVTAIGRDRDQSAVVAQEIYVPKDQDSWPPKGK